MNTLQIVCKSNTFYFLFIDKLKINKVALVFNYFLFKYYT